MRKKKSYLHVQLNEEDLDDFVAFEEEEDLDDLYSWYEGLMPESVYWDESDGLEYLEEDFYLEYWDKDVEDTE